MKMKAWAWTKGGAVKVDLPIKYWVEKPATMKIAKMIAPRTKKRSSELDETGMSDVMLATA